MKLKNLPIIKNEQHPFHLVSPSPWPLMVSLAVFDLALSVVLYFHYYKYSEYYIVFFMFLLFFFVGRWFTDIVVEATFQGFHTVMVQKGLRYGMMLFIVSEVMFFFSFFWAFFHNSLAPSIWIGCQWPPLGIQVINPWSLPLLNTVILVSSGVAVTYAHRAMLGGRRYDVIWGLSYAILLGVAFTFLQLFEYRTATFSINDSIYGSIFYMVTGFHGLHVIIGTFFLFICLLRHLKYHFLVEHHFGLEAAIWYWHFVDVIWLLLFIVVYWWGGIFS